MIFPKEPISLLTNKMSACDKTFDIQFDKLSYPVVLGDSDVGSHIKNCYESVGGYNRMILYLGFPLTSKFSFEISSSTAFTVGSLVNTILDMFQGLYSDSEMYTYFEMNDDISNDRTLNDYVLDQIRIKNNQVYAIVHRYNDFDEFECKYNDEHNEHEQHNEETTTDKQVEENYEDAIIDMNECEN